MNQPRQRKIAIHFRQYILAHIVTSAKCKNTACISPPACMSTLNKHLKSDMTRAYMWDFTVAF